MALIETLRKELIEAFDTSIGLEEHQEVRFYANANGMFFTVVDDKNAPLAIELGGVDAKLLATYEAYPEAKYLDYWKNELHREGTFTDGEFDEVLQSLNSDMDEDLDYTIYETLYDYEKFMLEHGHILRVYVVSVATDDASWVEFYPTMDTAMERVKRCLESEQKPLANKLKEVHMNISNTEYGVESDNHDYVEVIHRDEELAVRWLDPVGIDHVLKVHPYEVDSGEAYNVFQVKL